jgi:N-carbamoyl-L-amino-acid hydrolase
LSALDDFDSLWSELLPVGRHHGSGGYRRFAWTREDAVLREWFVATAQARGLDVVVDRAGNQWAWWGDPDAAAAAGRPGVVLGSHLDSVPDGGAYDGPLGVVSAFIALDRLRADLERPTRPVGIVNFVDEEGARFGVACGGSRLLTGTLDPDRARGFTDADGVTMAEAMGRMGHDPVSVGRDEETLRRVGAFVELHIEQGRWLGETDHQVAIGSGIIPHGRWRIELDGEANHAGTTRLEDRDDPMLNLATVITATRAAAQARGCVATVGKVQVQPNGVNAIPSRVTAWLDARGTSEEAVRGLAAEAAEAGAGRLVEESCTEATAFDADLRTELAGVLGDVPVLATGAGHDAGILALAGVPTAMLFVRNPTGVSHSPVEHAPRDDCHAGVEALTRVASALVRKTHGPDPSAS